MLIDTHAHLYSVDFKDDIEEVTDRALNAGVSRIILPNIDEESVEPMMKLVRYKPGLFFPLMGLHPTSVDDGFMEALDRVGKRLATGSFFGVGETGIDLYWDTSRQNQQEEAFRHQLRMAGSFNLPVVIHVRNSFEEVWRILEKEQQGHLSGIFHCFSGNLEQAHRVIEAGFFLGIGGVVTFKNASLGQIVQNVGPDSLVLETDAPWLSPVPFRGRRNESAFLLHIAEKVASLLEMTVSEIADITSANANALFNMT